jgi:hypothetical protein
MDKGQIIELARVYLSVDLPTPGGPIPALPPQLEKALELLTDPSDRAAMDVAVHVLGGKAYTLELDNRETLHRCQWLAIDLGANVHTLWQSRAQQAMIAWRQGAGPASAGQDSRHARPAAPACGLDRLSTSRWLRAILTRIQLGFR